MEPARTRRRRALLALLIGATCVAAAAWGPSVASAAGTLVGHWPMDETSGTTMVDSSPSQLNGTIGSAVRIGGGSYLFPGWTSNVDAAGHLFGTVPAAAGAVSVADPNDVFDPRTGDLSVSLQIRATLTAAGRLPIASGASYNIVQKARAGDPGGFWKLELVGSGTAIGKLRWVLSDGADTLKVVSKLRVDNGAWHSVRVERRGGQTVITVDGVSTAKSAAAIGDIHPTGKWSGTMTVGKKPGSTDPKDAFAGSIDELLIER